MYDYVGRSPKGIDSSSERNFVHRQQQTTDSIIIYFNPFWLD